MVCTEQFHKLALTVMRAQNVPESIGIHIKGNPEYISDEALMEVCDEVCTQTIEKLTKTNLA